MKPANYVGDRYIVVAPRPNVYDWWDVVDKKEGQVMASIHVSVRDADGVAQEIRDRLEKTVETD